MTKRDYTRVLFILLLALGLMYLVSDAHHENVNSHLKQALKEEKELFSKELRKKDIEIEKLSKKMAILEKDIALQENGK